MSLARLTSADMRALSKLIAEKEKLQAAIAKVITQIEGIDNSQPVPKSRKRRKPLSPAARARIAAGQRRRRKNERKANTPF